MLTIYELRELVKLLEQTDVESFEVKNEDSRLSIKRRLGEQPVVVQAPVTPAKLAVVTQVAPPKAEKPASSAAPVQPPASQVEETENLYKITSPMVGTFYAAPAADAAPYVSVHDQVQPTTIVCIVEAMKLFNEIEAEVKGEIVQILVENGQLVDQGQPLFLVKRV
ncbi:acetyl-CoA carboxylase biotin carboxyl carrier protein [uncultured Brevibacillus sp.]|uniref:acetyl-CoA carboxylase biotin carboxyl carrier protein n=1 Tax=uncultured Brevibacillus sp. TaxID=169970 RepID=UPI0025933BA9|nr:acetyl-CoA carboxylase biotin carboxyl carrier protein [uncultured Brevibacillus sp.]